MRQLRTVGLMGLALLLFGASQARADGGFGWTLQTSGHLCINFVPYCIPNSPYSSCAYAPYYQYGWPTHIPVYPGVEPGFGFAPTPWVLPPTPSGG